MMRKVKSATALGLVALTGLAACDLTENIVTGVTSTYYETPSGLEDAVKATYSRLHNFYAQEIHMTMTELGTDLWVKGSDGSHKHFNDYTAPLNPATGYVGQLWNDTYVSINTANAVITRGPNTQGMSEELRTQRIAEARFLRALFYFNLVRTYGDVHITLEETVGVVTEARRSPAAEVYQVIIEDLNFAEQNLPAVQSEDGRATRGAAQHLLALVYLTRADAGDLERALEKADAVINSGTYQLLPTWFDIYDINNQKNSEVVFSVQFTNDPLTRGAGNRFHLYYLMEYDVLPGMHRVVHYGRPWKRLRPTAKLLYLYDRDADTRFSDSFQDVWFATRDDAERGLAVGDTAVFFPHVKTSELPAEFHNKPYRIFTEPDNFWDPQQTPYGSEYEYRFYATLTKWLDPTRLTVNDEQSQRNLPIMRLAETYLLAAEALVRLGRPADAVPYLNAVRERAALPGMVDAMRITAADVDLDFVLDERGRELAGEGHRWFTLQRNGKLVDWVRAHNLDATPNIQDFHTLRPIPQTQIDRTQNSDGSTFGQNPGYN
jgi:starch-binding outer membrane protein, SusD/RagB family